jgi:hypothetical protein
LGKMFGAFTVNNKVCLFSFTDGPVGSQTPGRILQFSLGSLASPVQFISI